MKKTRITCSRRICGVVLALCMIMELAPMAAFASNIPSPPTNLRFETVESDPKQEMYIKWDKVAPPEGYQYVEYEIERYHNGQPAYEPGVDPFLTTYTVMPFKKALNPADGYSFRVRARGINVLGDIDAFPGPTTYYLGEPGPWSDWAVSDGSIQASDDRGSNQPDENQMVPGDFLDVNENDWYYNSVNYVFDNGILSGVSDNEFAPNADMDRGMIVTALWRMDGRKQAEAVIFADVAADAYYAGAVAWAAANDIVSGVSDNTFAPGAGVTREQMATIMYRYAYSKNLVANEPYNLNQFGDNSQISSWARGSVAWAVGAGLIAGKDGGILDPQGGATRAEVATVLMRLDEYLKNAN